MQNRKSILAIAVALVMGAAMIVPAAKAGESDQATKIQLISSKPLEVPGMVLPPGTYWFMVQDGQNAFNDQEKNIINIYNADRSKVLTTVQTRPVQRKNEGYGTANPSSSFDGVMFRIAQGSGNQPATLLTWFYPSQYSGHEFVYSDRDKKRLDEESSQEIVLKTKKGTDGVLIATLNQ